MGSKEDRVLKVNTFGLSPRARYGMRDRRNRGGPNAQRLSSFQLYQALRGATIAARLAHRGGDDRDLCIALTKAQAVGLEMARRLMTDTEVTVLEDPVDFGDSM